MKTITWKAVQVEVSKIKPTPNNYKLKTELGMERLRHSLKSFGLAGTVVLNTDLTLIDGNSRWEQAKEKGEKKIWASLPDRKLTSQEFKEMSALYDFAKAGEVDLDRIKTDLGSSKSFYDKWNLEVPISLLNKLGKGGGKAVITGASTAAEVRALEQKISTIDTRMVQLFFTAKQEAEFRSIEAKLHPKFKTDNISDLVFKVFKSLSK